MDLERERLRRAYNTTMQMCSDRGYNVPHTELSKAEFAERFGDDPKPSALDSVYSHKQDSDDRIALFWADAAKLGVAEVRDYMTKLQQQNTKSAIIVIQAQRTPSATKAIREQNARGFMVQVYEMSEIIVNITHHELVPKHVVLSADEKKTLLARYKLQEQQLPRMKVTDPVARYLGLRRGQVCKIIRNNSPTAGRYVSYRVVF